MSFRGMWIWVEPDELSSDVVEDGCAGCLRGEVEKEVAVEDAAVAIAAAAFCFDPVELCRAKRSRLKRG